MWEYPRETKDMFPTDIIRETILWFLHSKLRQTTLQELVYNRGTKDMYPTDIAGETKIWFIHSKQRETIL